MAVVRMYIEELFPGMKLARTVFSQDGRILVEEGVILTAEHIQKLVVWDIDHIFVDEQPTEEEPVSVQLKKEKMLQEAFLETHTRAVNTTKQLLNSLHAGDPIEEAVVSTSVFELLDKMSQDRNLLVGLTQIKTIDNMLFTKCVNVCALALVVGNYLGLSEDDMHLLGMAAFLHDTGMMAIGEEVWNHPGPLTREQEEQIKKHPEIGYERLAGFPEEVRRVALEHHERMDGSGYPKGLKGEDIHLFSRIVGLVDVYEALIARRKHREPMLPSDALRLIMTRMKGLFDDQILKAFMGHMALFPIGTIVKLSTGEVGRITGANRDKPFRPILKILWDAEGSAVEPPRKVDLADERHWKVHISETAPESAYQEALDGVIFL